MADVKENKQETQKIEDIFPAAAVVGAPPTIQERKVEPVAGSIPNPAPFVPVR